MEELLEYRRKLFDQLSAAGERLRTACAARSDTHASPQAGVWNRHQVVVHLRDVNRHVYLPRLQRIVNEENPTFDNFDADAWMSIHYNPDEPLTAVVEEFSTSCTATAGWLRSLPREPWNRPGTHPSLGTHTLQWWFERALAHIEEHLGTLEKK